jgi:hypothetical protein
LKLNLPSAGGLFIFAAGGALLILSLYIMFTTPAGGVPDARFAGLVIGFFSFLLIGLGLYFLIDNVIQKNR